MYPKQYFKMNYQLDGQSFEELLEDEPIKWDGVDIICRRDNDYFGVNYMHSDGDVDLLFDKTSGASIIEKVFDKHGTDGNIVLEVGLQYKNKLKPDYFGKVDLNTYKKEIDKNKEYISCTLETTGIHETVIARKDTTVNLWDTKSLDNVNMSALRWSNVKLKSITIDRESSFKADSLSVAEVPAEDDNVYAKNPFWFTLSIDGSSDTNDIKDFNGSTGSILKNSGFTDALDQEYLTPLILSQEIGALKFVYDLGVYVEGSFDDAWYSWPGFENCHIYMFIVKVKDGEKLSIDYFDNSNAIDHKYTYGESDSRLDDRRVKMDIRFTGTANPINVEIGDKVYLIFKIEWDFYGDANSVTFKITQRSRSIKISSQTTAPESPCYGMKLKDAFTTVLESISGDSTLLKSNLLDFESGDFGKYVLATGFGLRNFDNPETYPDNLKPFSTSLKELLSSLKSHYPICVCYEYGQDGKQYFRIEKIEYCFQDNEIIKLSEVSDLRHEIAKELIYNEIEIGYSKYPDDGEKFLDEYNTKLTFSTPISTNKNKLSLLSSFVGATYAIEETRRYQFIKNDEEDTSTTSTKWDENIFIIAVNSEMKSEGLESFSVKNIEASTQNGSPYNLRITPKRNLYRWAKWINGGLSKKDGSSFIKNTSYIKNGNAVTKCNDNSDVQGDITEKDSINLNSFDSRRRLYYPIWISFNTRMSFDDLKTVLSALTNEQGANKNGYISFEVNGKIKQGWPWEIRYNLTSEKVSFKLLQKDLLLTDEQLSCSDFKHYTSGDFEKMSSLPDFIEDCTFDNFD